MKGRGGQIDPPEKTTFKKPSLIKVNKNVFQEYTDLGFFLRPSHLSLGRFCLCVNIVLSSIKLICEKAEINKWEKRKVA